MPSTAEGAGRRLGPSSVCRPSRPERARRRPRRTTQACEKIGNGVVHLGQRGERGSVLRSFPSKAGRSEGRKPDRPTDLGGATPDRCSSLRPTCRCAHLLRQLEFQFRNGPRRVRVCLAMAIDAMSPSALFQGVGTIGGERLSRLNTRPRHAPRAQPTRTGVFLTN